MQLGRALFDHGEFAQARASLEQALTLARATGSLSLVAACLPELGFACFYQRDYEASLRYHGEGLQIYQEIGHPRGEAWALWGLGLTHMFRGDYDEAGACCEQSLRIQRVIGDRHGESQLLMALGMRSHFLGQYTKARACYQESLDMHSETGHRRSAGMILSSLSGLFHDLGDDAAAYDNAQQVVELGRAAADRPVQVPALARLGDALLGLGRLDEAASAYRDALAIMRELNQYWRVSAALAALARMAMVRRDLAQAQAHVDVILNYLENDTLEGVPRPLLVYLTCYRVLRASDDPRAEDILEEAYRFLQERAAKISDEEERRSYLENVAANREVTSAYTEGEHDRRRRTKDD